MLRRNECLVFCLVILFCFVATTCVRAEDSAGSLSADDIRSYQEGVKLDGATRALYNAITNNSVNSLSLNRELVRSDDGLFSDVIKTKGVTDQKESGRCWIFSAMNVLRPAVIEKYNLDAFELSQNYLAFWDKLEKANCFLEFAVELSDRDILDREWELQLKTPLPEGGWWGFVVELVEKYGVVPKDAMPETQSSDHTKTMQQVLESKLRANALALRKMKQSGKSMAEIRAEKNKMLAETYKILVLTLGEPPREFQWRYKDKDEKVSALKTYTPKKFYRDFVGGDLSQYVCLVNDPSQSYRKHFQLQRTRSLYDGRDMHYVNLEVGDLKSITAKSICDKQPVWFAADVNNGEDREKGIMAADVRDYQSLFGMRWETSKADRFLLRDLGANHAMTFLGVDLRDGKPVKWLVENSWGKDKGKEGKWTMYDSFFNENVFCVIVRKAYVPNDVLVAFSEKPVALPPWYPMSEALR